jgi:dTDP-4-amino-4,6-dideoxygalactose transaminase
MKEKIPFYKSANINIDNIKLNSNILNNIESLENECCKFFDTPFAVATSSGANALHLALCALDIKRGDKIICSVNSFVSTPQAVRHFDAEPIFVDINSQTYMMDLDKLETTLKTNDAKKLRAIIINSMGGAVLDMQKVVELSKEYNVKVIFDATDAMGTTYRNNELGNMGADMVIFSFSPNIHKDILSGGILALNDELIYKRAIMLRSNGISNQLEHSSSQANYAYDIMDIGYDYSMNEISALACMDRLVSLENDIKRKREIADLYTKGLNGVSHITIKTASIQTNVVQFFIEIDKNRDHFARELIKEGIEIALHYVPLHLSEYYRTKYSLKVFDFPAALGIYQQTMSLPIYPSMPNEDVFRVIEAIKNVASSYMK